MECVPFDIHAEPFKLRMLANDIEKTRDQHYLRGVEPTAMLAQWKPGLHFVTHLTGRVHGHPLIADGRQIATSQLFYLNEELGLARSLSRWYRLGARRDGSTPERSN
jgi:hypothetical protein